MGSFLELMLRLYHRAAWHSQRKALFRLCYIMYIFCLHKLTAACDLLMLLWLIWEREKERILSLWKQRSILLFCSSPQQGRLWCYRDSNPPSPNDRANAFLLSLLGALCIKFRTKKIIHCKAIHFFFQNRSNGKEMHPGKKPAKEWPIIVLRSF